MKRVGLIGVGNIGKHYTRRLLEDGYPLTVLDLDPQRVAYAVEQGAESAANPAELTERVDVVVLSLPSSVEVQAVMDGPQGILSALRPGQLVVDTGTSRVATDLRYAQLCQAAGAGYLDSPITWRAQGLILMVGGSEEDYQAGLDVLTSLSYKVRHVGPIGSGQLLKGLNQMLQAGQLAVFAEAVEFARQNEVDPNLLSEYLEFPVPEILLGDDFAAGGQLALHYKDLGYVLEYAHDSEASIPLTALVHEIFKAAKRHGDPNWMQPGIVTYWRRLNKGE